MRISLADGDRTSDAAPCVLKLNCAFCFEQWRRYKKSLACFSLQISQKSVWQGSDDTFLKLKAKICECSKICRLPIYQNVCYTPILDIFLITVTNLETFVSSPLSCCMLPLGWDIQQLHCIKGRLSALKCHSGLAEDTRTTSSILTWMWSWSNRPLTAPDICCTAATPELNRLGADEQRYLDSTADTFHIDIHLWHQPAPLKVRS